MKDATDIQVGDTIYLQERIKYGWLDYKTFTIAHKVERTTKTQFVTDTGLRFQKSGRGIGNNFYASLNGKDQSKERDAFVKKLKDIDLIYSEIYKLSKGDLVNWEEDDLSVLKKLVEKYG